MDVHKSKEWLAIKIYKNFLNYLQNIQSCIGDVHVLNDINLFSTLYMFFRWMHSATETLCDLKTIQLSVTVSIVYMQNLKLCNTLNNTWISPLLLVIKLIDINMAKLRIRTLNFGFWTNKIWHKKLPLFLIWHSFRHHSDGVFECLTLITKPYSDHFSFVAQRLCKCSYVRS